MSIRYGECYKLFVKDSPEEAYWASAYVCELIKRKAINPDKEYLVINRSEGGESGPGKITYWKIDKN